MLRIAYTDHLVALVARAESAGTRLGLADPDRLAALVPPARRDSSRLSVRLDGSPLDDATADRVDRDGHPREAPDDAVDDRPPSDRAPRAPDDAVDDRPPSDRAPRAPDGWTLALKLEGMATQAVAAVEYGNLLEAFDAEPALAPGLFERPLETLRELHGMICRGLLAPGVAGRLRRTEQAVHDGAQGRVIYNIPPPGALPGRMDELARWLGQGAATVPTLAVAGIVQERLLEWHPFEAANGRLARAASRLVLRARGLDAHGVGVVERVTASDPAGYYGEVAATIRRRGDLVPWLERYGEEAVAALESAAEAVDPSDASALAPRARRIAEDLPPGDRVTLAEYAQRAGISHEAARDDLRALARAGLLHPVPRSRGLRFERR